MVLGAESSGSGRAVSGRTEVGSLPWDVRGPRNVPQRTMGEEAVVTKERRDQVKISFKVVESKLFLASESEVK